MHKFIRSCRHFDKASKIRKPFENRFYLHKTIAFARQVFVD